MWKFRAEYVKHNNFPVLFISLLFFFIGISLFESADTELLTNLLITQVIFAGAYTVSESRKIYFSAIFSGALFLVIRWAEHLFPNNELVFQSLAILLMTAFMIIVLKNMLTYLLASKEVNTNLILGVISGYLLIGVVFTFGFSFVEILTIEPALNYSTPTPEIKDILYYTMVTLTTIGYGDITPNTDSAKFLSYALGVIGQMYMGIIMAFIIGKFLQSKPNTKSAKGK